MGQPLPQGDLAPVVGAQEHLRCPRPWDSRYRKAILRQLSERRSTCAALDHGTAVTVRRSCASCRSAGAPALPSTMGQPLPQGDLAPVVGAQEHLRCPRPWDSRCRKAILRQLSERRSTCAALDHGTAVAVHGPQHPPATTRTDLSPGHLPVCCSRASKPPWNTLVPIPSTSSASRAGSQSNSADHSAKVRSPSVTGVRRRVAT